MGGYSYEGFLTNWLLTQITRFNAVISGAGAIELASAWGTMNAPVLFSLLLGRFPWEFPDLYRSESAIYYLDKVRTPTHLVTGSKDVYVDTDLSYILKRGLHSRKLPIESVVFLTK